MYINYQSSWVVCPKSYGQHGLGWHLNLHLSVLCVFLPCDHFHLTEEPTACKKGEETIMRVWNP